MLKSVMLAGTILAIAVPACASVYTYDLSGPFNSGTLQGVLSVDVMGGVATSGEVTLGGPGITGVQPLYLTAPGAVYEATGGTEVSGSDNLWPISWNGLTFGSNAPSTLTGGYVFGLWDNGGKNYQGFVGGPDQLWAFTGALTLSAPETSTWAMLLLGFSGLGYAGFRARRSEISIA
jgi:hypothetical protein